MQQLEPRWSSHLCRGTLPWTLLYADEVMLACKGELEREQQAWCHRLERFGLKLDVKKTEYLTTNVTESSSIKVKCSFHALQSLSTWDQVASDRKLMVEVNSRVSAAWSKWRSFTGVQFVFDAYLDGVL
ncbi:unnamed protein product [Heligmosomoides polygyrus]|uniref:Reverse transcriptase domain-containing protein n=1 Tax=Heligmosomoides polygyrus TaxID=6339 RepID=A0A183G0F8_HELPZ|nr:unnamed protein product [Heligmosomoides polygyrus]